MWFKNKYADIWIFVFGKVEEEEIPKKERPRYLDPVTHKRIKNTDTYYNVKNGEVFCFYDYSDDNFNMWGMQYNRNFKFDRGYNDDKINHTAIKRIFEGKRNDGEFDVV